MGFLKRGLIWDIPILIFASVLFWVPIKIGMVQSSPGGRQGLLHDITLQSKALHRTPWYPLREPHYRASSIIVLRRYGQVAVGTVCSSADIVFSKVSVSKVIERVI